MMETIISVNNLDKSYGKHQVLFDFNLKVKRGECLGVVGPNGAGKTTLLECIEGLRKWQKGEIIIDGRTIEENPKYLRSIMGVQLQSSSLPDEIKVKEAIELFAVEHNVSINEKLLDELDVGNLVNQQYGKLSTGQKRRLHLLLAILHDPEIIILDEPTAGLDVNAKYLLYLKINQLKESGKTILLTSHDMYEVENLCDRVAFLENGRVGKEITKDSILDQDKQIIVVSTKKQSLKNVDMMYSTLIEEKEAELFFECSNISACLKELLEHLNSKDDEIIDLYIKKKTVEEELTKMMRGEGK
ncbi:MAG: ABC transporter ATP-binding protein [Bacilli bacterium]|jgi:ABC-2 type transport system ATP-binding protein|nr:ABC transporter ATP-binding protein [Bacilli bacterium]